MRRVQHDAADSPGETVYTGTYESDTTPQRRTRAGQNGRMESTPQEVASNRHGIHRAQPPSESLWGNGVPQGEAQQAGDDCVNPDGGRDIAVLGANQLGSD
jgi:hypothetical protein